MNKGMKIFLCVLTVLSVLYIFSNSVKSDKKVENTKGKVVETVEAVIEAVVDHDVDLKKISGKTVSKIGHMLEYFIFSALFSFSVFYIGKKRLPEFFYRIMFACLFVAVTDEHLQLLGKGRSSSVSDILVDLSACFLGYLFSCLIFDLRERRK